MPNDPVAALRAYAVKLHDKDDGRGVDWAKVAEAAFRVAFSCLRELPLDDKSLKSVVRRVHDPAYSLMTDTPDSGAPYMVDRPNKPPFTSDAGLRPDLELDR